MSLSSAKVVAPYLAPAGAVDVSGEDATTFADDKLKRVYALAVSPSLVPPGASPGAGAGASGAGAGTVEEQLEGAWKLC